VRYPRRIKKRKGSVLGSSFPLVRCVRARGGRREGRKFFFAVRRRLVPRVAEDRARAPADRGHGGQEEEGEEKGRLATVYREKGFCSLRSGDLRGGRARKGKKKKEKGVHAPGWDPSTCSAHMDQAWGGKGRGGKKKERCLRIWERRKANGKRKKRKEKKKEFRLSLSRSSDPRAR